MGKAALHLPHHSNHLRRAALTDVLAAALAAALMTAVVLSSLDSLCWLCTAFSALTLLLRVWQTTHPPSRRGSLDSNGRRSRGGTIPHMYKGGEPLALNREGTRLRGSPEPFDQRLPPHTMAVQSRAVRSSSSQSNRCSTTRTQVSGSGTRWRRRRLLSATLLCL